MGLDPEATYTEAAVNGAIGDWKRDVAPAIETDHVTLRRLFVDYGQLERTRDGRHYRVGFPPRPLARARKRAPPRPRKHPRAWLAREDGQTPIKKYGSRPGAFESAIAGSAAS